MILAHSDALICFSLEQLRRHPPNVFWHVEAGFYQREEYVHAERLLAVIVLHLRFLIPGEQLGQVGRQEVTFKILVEREMVCLHH